MVTIKLGSEPEFREGKYLKRPRGGWMASRKSLLTERHGHVSSLRIHSTWRLMVLTLLIFNDRGIGIDPCHDSAGHNPSLE